MNNEEMFRDNLKIKRETLIDDLRFNKLQIWRTLYLTILGLAATISLYLKIGIHVEELISYFKFTVWFLSVGGILLIIFQNIQQHGYRKKIETIDRLLHIDRLPSYYGFKVSKKNSKCLFLVKSICICMRRFIQNSIFARVVLFLILFLGVIGMAFYICLRIMEISPEVIKNYIYICNDINI